ncbi:hypothetical protein C0992_006167 [Termitomyces sp. T32_za158]|nr:hypothetical protein C0992_006167 [Termitomyces sp. T32_za158]
MSSNKYADLPDIDTAPDVYETLDTFQSAQDTNDEESDEEIVPRSRNGNNGREEIDSSNLIDHAEASRRFLKAERKHWQRTYYTYPPDEDSPNEPTNTRSLSLSARLRSLHTELTALEAELADPSNPKLAKEREVDNVDPGELIRGLVDVRGRLDKIRKGKEGRAKLVGAVLGEDREREEEEPVRTTKDMTAKNDESKPETRTIAEMDRRVGELEKLVGSSSASLDETTPLPPPLLPLITRLNSQLTFLAQPRHLDSISRRLKILQSDLERANAAQQQAARRQLQQPESDATTPAPQHIQDTVLPILSRLGPALPQIPHILTRLRTLATLHTSAAEFEETLRGVEEEQRKMHETLAELDGAVSRVEKSLEENRGVVRGNVSGLESRVDSLLNRIEELSRPGDEIGIPQ